MNKNKNDSGSRIDPCETPHIKGTMADVNPIIFLSNSLLTIHKLTIQSVWNEKNLSFHYTTRADFQLVNLPPKHGLRPSHPVGSVYSCTGKNSQRENGQRSKHLRKSENPGQHRCGFPTVEGTPWIERSENWRRVRRLSAELCGEVRLP